MATEKISLSNRIVTGTRIGTVDVPSGSITEIGSITLPAGQWLIMAASDWTANGQGFRQTAFEGISVNPARDRAVTSIAIEGKEVYQKVVCIFENTSEYEAKMYGYQNSGSVVKVAPHIIAIKLQ